MAGGGNTEETRPTAGAAAEPGDKKDLIPPAASRRARRSLAPRVSEERLSWKDDMRKQTRVATEVTRREPDERMKNSAFALAALTVISNRTVRVHQTEYPKSDTLTGALRSRRLRAILRLQCSLSYPLSYPHV